MLDGLGIDTGIDIDKPVDAGEFICSVWDVNDQRLASARQNETRCTASGILWGPIDLAISKNTTRVLI
jgi:hypothetical protein